MINDSNNRPNIHSPATRAATLALIFMLGCLSSFSAQASDAIPKEVSLIINGKRLIASNVRLSRFDEIKLNAQERVTKQSESKGVIVIVTNQRFIGYGVSSGWHDLKTQAGEKIESLRAEDFAAFISTNKRYLNFNGETGVWAEQNKRTER